MARIKKTPAEVVIETFGVRPLAREIRVNPSTIIRWREREDGRIPSGHYAALLKLAKKQKKALTPNDLVIGR